MNKEFQRLYGQLVEDKITSGEFIDELKLAGDYSDDLLSLLQHHLASGNQRMLNRLMWAIQWVPSRKFTPL